MGDEAEARQRLVHLLEYVKEVARPPTTNRAAPTTLPSGEGVVVLHEAQLRKLSELQSSRSGQPTVWLSGDGKAGIWCDCTVDPNTFMASSTACSPIRDRGIKQTSVLR